MAPNRPIEFRLAAKPSAWDYEHSDQLVQMEVAMQDGAVHRYFLFWHRPSASVLLEVEHQQEWYWSCGMQTLTHLIRYFQGGLEAEREFQVTDAWTGRGDIDINTILNIPFTTIKNQHDILSVDCNW